MRIAVTGGTGFVGGQAFRQWKRFKRRVLAGQPCGVGAVLAVRLAGLDHNVRFCDSAHSSPAANAPGPSTSGGYLPVGYFTPYYTRFCPLLSSISRGRAIGARATRKEWNRAARSATSDEQEKMRTGL